MGWRKGSKLSLGTILLINMSINLELNGFLNDQSNSRV